jgi:hypothetical protein
LLQRRIDPNLTDEEFSEGHLSIVHNHDFHEVSETSARVRRVH